MDEANAGSSCGNRDHGGDMHRGRKAVVDDWPWLTCRGRDRILAALVPVSVRGAAGDYLIAFMLKGARPVAR